ncbi:MAG: hypothetical protein P1V20_18415 [Verrucomicrobiales bacterium]|nr:hypothetical protein [Verrucomicrobiales bacterium]
MINFRVIAALVCVPFSIGEKAEAQKDSVPDPGKIEEYKKSDHLLSSHTAIRKKGWHVHLNKSLLIDNRERTSRMLELLDIQLQRVVEAVPDKALGQLREIPIWINPPYPGDRGRAEFHPNRNWLEQNGRNPEMARAVEITNVDIFLFEHRRMPYLLLHELAHGYHFRNLPEGYSNPQIKAAFERAKMSGLYDEVDRFDGNRIRKDKAYAITNPMEYFAESTEAYFGKNDFFPFNQKELREHDPSMFNLLGRLWGVPD